MKFEISFCNEIKKIKEHPSTFDQLKKEIVKLFGDNLPRNYSLQYLDDKLVELKNQENYQKLIDTKANKLKKLILILRVETDESAENSSNIQTKSLSSSFEIVQNGSFDDLSSPRSESEDVEERKKEESKDDIKEGETSHPVKENKVIDENQALNQDHLNKKFEEEIRTRIREESEDEKELENDNQPLIKAKGKQSKNNKCLNEKKNLEKENISMSEREVHSLSKFPQSDLGGSKKEPTFQKELNSSLLKPTNKEGLKENMNPNKFIKNPDKNYRKIEKKSELLSKPTFESNSKDIQKIKEQMKLKEVQELIELKEDIQSMPTCAEKSLSSLCHYCSLQLIDEKYLMNQEFSSISLEISVEEEFNNIFERIQKENLPLQKESLKKILSNFKNKEFKIAKEELEAILTSIRPLNYQKIQRLINESEKATDSVHGQNAIVLLGGSGCGKTLIIHFLAGSKMKKITIDGINHFAPIQYSPNLAKATTSPSDKSETQNITSINVNLKELGLSEDENVVFLDTAGFGDTRGAEVDIANGVCIQKALQNCKSVKPVLVLSYKANGDRYTGFKSLAHILVGMMPEIKDHIGSFTFLFTKYPKEEEDKIHASLEFLYKNMTKEEKSDEGFSYLLKNMVKKTKKKTLIIDPINGNPKDILEEIDEVPGIKYPGEVFQFSIAESSKSLLQNQVHKDQLAILNGLKFHDYDFIKYKLDIMKRFSDLLGFDFLKQKYLDCVNSVKNHLNEKYRTAVSSINRCLEEENALNEEDVKSYENSIHHLEAAHLLRESHLGKEVVQSSALFQNIQTEIEVILKDFEERNLNNLGFKKFVDKIHILSQTFPKLKSKYEQLEQIIINKVEESKKSFSEALSQDAFDICGQELTKFEEAIILFEEHPKYLAKIKKEKKLLEGLLLENFEISINEQKSMLAKERLGEEEVNSLKACLSRFELLESTLLNQKHFLEEKILPMSDLLIQSISKHFEEINLKIQQIFEQEKQSSFETIEILLKEMKLIRIIGLINPITSDMYYSTINKVCSFVLEYKANITEELNLIIQGCSNVNYLYLLDAMTGLKNAKWLEEFNQDVHSNAMKNLEERVLQSSQILFSSLENLSFDLDNYDKVRVAFSDLTKIIDMKPLEKIFPTLKKEIDSAEIFFKKEIDNAFNTIQKYLETFSQDQEQILSFNLKKFEKSILYLNECLSINFLRTDSKSLMEKIEDLIKLKGEALSNQMNEMFEMIVQKSNDLSSPLNNLDNQNEEVKINDDNFSDCSRIDYLVSSTGTFFKKEDSSIHKHCQILSNFLQRILEIERKFPIISRILDPDHKMVPQWREKLTEQLDYLEEEMGELRVAGRLQDLKLFLRLTKSLSKLDQIMKERKFNNLYNEYRQKFFTDAPEKFQKTMEDIKSVNSLSVLRELVELSRSEDKTDQANLKIFQEVLSDSVEDLIEETKSMVKFLYGNAEKMNHYRQNMKRIQNAKDIILYTNLTTQKLFENFFHENKEKINQLFIKEIQKIRNQIRNLEFIEFDNKKDHLTNIYAELGTYCSEDIHEKISSLGKDQEDFLKELSEECCKLKIEDYARKPPKDILTKLSQCSHQNPLYREIQDKIEQSILEEVRGKMNDIKNLNSESSIPIKEIEIKLKYLSDNLIGTLGDELAMCAQQIDLKRSKDFQELNRILENNDLKEISKFLEQKRSSQENYKLVQAIQHHISHHLQKISNELDENLKMSNFRVVLPLLCQLRDLKETFACDFQMTVSIFSDKKLNFQMMVKKDCDLISKEITKSDLSLTPDDILPKFEEKLQNLLEMFYLRSDPKIHHCFNEIISKELYSFIEISKKFSENFEKESKKIETALKDLDIPTIEKILTIIKKWENFYKILKFQSENETTVNPESNLSSEFLDPAISFFGVKRLVFEKISLLKELFLEKKLLTEETKGLSCYRNAYFEQFHKELIAISQVSQRKIFQPDFSFIFDECNKSFQEKANEIYSMAKSLVKDILIDGNASIKKLSQLNIVYENLVALQVFMKEDQGKKESIEETIIQEVNNLSNLIKKPMIPLEEVAAILKKMKILANNLYSFKPIIDKIINETLISFKNTNGGNSIIGKLGKTLNEDKSGIGSIILSEHKCFEFYQVYLFNSKIQTLNIDHFFKELKNDGYKLEKSALEIKYSHFLKKYEELLNIYLVADIQFDQLISDTLLFAGKVVQNPKKITWDHNMTSKIPELIAYLFALWTLQNSKHFFETNDLDNRYSYLKKPHVAQVISIFCLLGLAEKRELQNNLVQIKTGEGKSVTLAIAASVFALFGFDVNCACYSTYLSERDYEEFRSLFECLNISDRIHYGTFNKLCEDMINQKGDIRKIVENLTSKDDIGDNIVLEIKHSNLSKILLIDEVDVFFSKEFYGQIYNPVATLKDPTISNLIDLIWKIKDSSPSFEDVKKSEEYKACCTRFKNYEPLIKENVKSLIFDVKEYSSHSYIIKDDKIGYKDQDKIVFNIVHGYQTLFAFYKEHENGKITKESLEENKAFKIKCGNYSYAEIPRQFKYIMGVTGTLESLSDSEKEVIKKDYKITRSTFIPSMFGKNNLRFSPKCDVFVEPENNYHNAINREIEARLTGKLKGTKRAVLVFFETEKHLKDFYNSKSFLERKDSSLYLTEEATKQEKELIVKQSTQSGKVTLLTKIFGRGTDFIVYDEEVSKNGGVHVLQTFLSEESSEEIQIKGRTARQGDDGTFSIVVLESSLEKFGIMSEELEKVKNGATVTSRILGFSGLGPKVYDTELELMYTLRNEFMKNQYEENKKYIRDAQKLHDDASNFLKDLINRNLPEVKKYLYKQNNGPAFENITSRTVVLLDGTGSMSDLIQKAKQTIEITFERAFEILNDHKINPECFQVQFAIYRNYNCSEDKLLQCSPWETRADNLRNFMNLVHVEGGLGREAIEVGLWHANKENEKERVSQVILIGDAPANTKEEVQKKRNSRNWKNTKFEVPTYYGDEMKKLKDNNIPIHAFYVKEYAETNFREISSATGGLCEELDIHSSAGADMLTNIVTEAILKNIGENNGKGKTLVDAYRKKFIPSYQ